MTLQFVIISIWVKTVWGVFWNGYPRAVPGYISLVLDFTKSFVKH